MVTEQKGKPIKRNRTQNSLYLKQLRGSPQDMASQVLANSWKDETKENALDVVEQYVEYLTVPFQRPNFRAYDNEEMYVPSHEMIKQFL